MAAGMVHPDRATGENKAANKASDVVVLEFYEVWRFAKPGAPVPYTMFRVGEAPSVATDDFMLAAIPYHGRIRIVKADGSHEWSDDYRVKCISLKSDIAHVALAGGKAAYDMSVIDSRQCLVVLTRVLVFGLCWLRIG
jgi:hypothetical protein